LGDIDPGLVAGTLLVSPDWRHAAYVARVGEARKCFVMLDGVQGKQYDSIFMLTFSPDSKRLAYAARSADKTCVVVDGAEGKAYEEIVDMTFSPDSKRFAYKAKPALEDNWLVVADGKEGKHYNSAGRPVFSPDSAHLVYSEWSQYGANKGAATVVDGTEGKAYAGVASDPVFSPDSKHMAFAVKTPEDDSAMVVLDGKEQKAYDGLPADLFGGAGNTQRYLVFSPDSSRLAYIAKTGDKHVAVVDGKEGKTYSEIAPLSLTFSPDSKRIAYAAANVIKAANTNLANWLVVIDGAEGKEYSTITETNIAIAFSPDSAHIAYCAFSQSVMTGQGVVVKDGVEGKSYGQSPEPPIFSPDSKHLAYIIRPTPQWVIAVDSREENLGDDFIRGALAFTPDSKYAACIAKVGNKWMVAVGGAKAGDYDSAIANGRLVFDSPTNLHTIFVRKNKLYVADITIAEPAQMK
jgi:hypothetical protein